MQSGGDKITPLINVTPLIDVLLVLLIIFMMLPSRTKGLPSEVPQRAAENQPAQSNPQHLVLRIRNDHSMDINAAGGAR